MLPILPTASIGLEPTIIAEGGEAQSIILNLTEPAPDGGLVVNVLLEDPDGEGGDAPPVFGSGVNIDDVELSLKNGQTVILFTVSEGAKTASFDFAAVDDGVEEGIETFSLNLIPSTSDNYQIGKNNKVTSTIVEVENTLDGTSETDFLFGTYRRDLISGREGSDVIFSFDSDDFVLGGAGKDSIFAGEGNDLLLGEAGSDNILGDSGEDSLHGGEGNDFLLGGDGEDLLHGGEGNDRIDGKGGADILTGDGGMDTFTYKSLKHSTLDDFDTITDLKVGTDKIKGTYTVDSSEVAQLGAVETLDEAGIQAVLTESEFITKGAATFTFDAQTFVALNDEEAGYLAADDALIEITGFVGSIDDLAVV